MNAAPQKLWTVDRFLDWVGRQAGRYQFDGTAPVAIVGSTIRPHQITLNTDFALRARLPGTPCRAFASGLGIRTVGQSVRHPDGLITCGKVTNTERLAPGVAVVKATHLGRSRH
jgi:hypothetical protein